MINLARLTEAAPTTEADAGHDRILGRVVEAKGTDEGGGRVFGVRIIAYGDSLNGRRYPESVMRAAVPLYEGAKAYDHHRDDGELRSSTINGMVGYFAGVTAGSEGLDADLHLLPGATHTAEALDATLAAQGRGLPPLVGVSHDVMAAYRPVVAGGRRMQEATQIVKVNSADVVADPAAGGAITRMVAGGIEGDGDVVEVEPLHDTGTARGRQVVTQEATARGLPDAVIEHVVKALPARFSEAQLSAAIDAIHAAQAHSERAGLVPDVGRVQVTQESRDKKAQALDAMLDTSATSAGGGYRSLREAYMDISGHRPSFLTEDLNKRIMRDSMGGGYDSAMRGTESMSSSSWSEVLGDSITRRLMAEYARPSLMAWQQVVSSVQTGLDFRTQRRGRIGGFGILPAVNQGQPYQPLTSPTDEEATYAVTKRGGTEDITLEMIANDDIQALRLIPVRLGRSAAITLYRFVFDMLPTNAAVTYDATTLFHTNHANTASAALSQSALTAGRKAMRRQASYGDSTDLMSFVPKLLVVPTDLEELAVELCTSKVALPSGAPTGAASDIPNLHYGMTPLVIDYYTDTNDWYLVADPMQCPTIELGFYSTSPSPELFTQSDPSQGSMFNSDTLTFKIRHAYSGTVLDHRGFYRGAN